jgi:hypothetical protein
MNVFLIGAASVLHQPVFQPKAAQNSCTESAKLTYNLQMGPGC